MAGDADQPESPSQPFRHSVLSTQVMCQNSRLRRLDFSRVAARQTWLVRGQCHTVAAFREVVVG